MITRQVYNAASSAEARPFKRHNCFHRVYRPFRRLANRFYLAGEFYPVQIN